MNKFIYNIFGINETWDKATDILLVAIILFFGLFVFNGISQFIKHKSLKKVDKELLCMIPSLVLILIIYFIFDKVWVVNYRPILVNGMAEPSFPSTHSLIAVTLSVMMMIALPKYIKKRSTLITLDVILGICAAVVMFGRVASGMHWFSDVVGGLIFGLILGLIYYLILKKMKGADNE